VEHVENISYPNHNLILSITTRSGSGEDIIGYISNHAVASIAVDKNSKQLDSGVTESERKRT